MQGGVGAVARCGWAGSVHGQQISVVACSRFPWLDNDTLLHIVVIGIGLPWQHTTGNSCFLECPIHSTKDGLLSAKSLLVVALGKGLSANILSVKGVFAESQVMPSRNTCVVRSDDSRQINFHKTKKAIHSNLVGPPVGCRTSAAAATTAAAAASTTTACRHYHHHLRTHRRQHHPPPPPPPPKREREREREREEEEREGGD
jgi:hypothetical protein